MSLQKQIRKAAKRKSTEVRDTDFPALSRNEIALAGVVKWLLAVVKDDAIAWRPECRWTAPALIAVAILWIWLDGPTLTGCYKRSLKIGRRLYAAVPDVSYTAFTKLLGRHTRAALDVMKPR